MKYYFLLIGLLIVVGCSRGSEQVSLPKETSTIEVRVVEVASNQASQVEEFAGSFVAINKVNLSTRLSGWITLLDVEEGDFVQRDDVIALLDARDIQAQMRQADAGVHQAEAQVEQARAQAAAADAVIDEARSALQTAKAMLPEASAQYELAKIEYKRVEHLHREGAVSDQDRDRAKTQVEVAEAKIEQLNAGISRAEAAAFGSEQSAAVARSAVIGAQAGANQARAARAVAQTPLEYATVTSPIDGYVVKKSAYVGEMATPGQVLVSIEDTSHLRLEVPVPEARVGRFAPGDEFKVLIDALDGDFVGRVDGIVPSADPSSRTFIVKLRVENPTRRILPGMYGRVLTPTGTTEIFSVPSEAVVQRGELQGIFLVGPDQTAEYRLVKLGPEIDGQHRVLSGLNEPSKVIVSPPAELRSGSILEI